MRDRTATVCLRVAAGCLILGGLIGASGPQTDWLCQGKQWEANSTGTYRSNWYRNQNDQQDLFRLRIISSTEIRITGSDFLKNGSRRIQKKGSKYIFIDRVATTNQYGFTRTPRGIAYFDSSNGEFYSETTGAMIAGIQKYYLISGNCE